jgi:hypothetical protein
MELPAGTEPEFPFEAFNGPVAGVGCEIAIEDHRRDHEILRGAATEFETRLAGFIHEDEHESYYRRGAGHPLLLAHDLNEGMCQGSVGRSR